MKREAVSRRAFLRNSSLFACGVAAGFVLSEGCTPEKRVESPGVRADGPLSGPTRNPRMGYRRLGRTGLMVSEIVLASHFSDPLIEPSWDRFTTGDVPAEVAKSRTEVVSRCIEHGINCVDVTCGRDALACGAALKGRRDKMYVTADDAEYAVRQNRHRNAESQVQSIESCLRKLGTDYLDVWRPQFKPLGGHRDVDLEMCVAVFEKARSQGKTRFLGMSTEDWAWMQHVIQDFPQYTVVYAPCPLSSPTPSPVDLQQAFFDAAKAKETGVILTYSPGESSEAMGSVLPRILANLQVTAACVDMTSSSDVDKIVQVLSEGQAAAGV
jgi:diketogulonate reductase-like aldo/keto reductase